MLDKEQIEAAARVLRSHWRDGVKIGALDDAMRPRDRAEGYAI